MPKLAMAHSLELFGASLGPSSSSNTRIAWLASTLPIQHLHSLE